MSTTLCLIIDEFLSVTQAKYTFVISFTYSRF